MNQIGFCLLNNSQQFISKLIQVSNIILKCLNCLKTIEYRKRIETNELTT